MEIKYVLIKNESKQEERNTMTTEKVKEWKCDK